MSEHPFIDAIIEAIFFAAVGYSIYQAQERAYAGDVNAMIALADFWMSRNEPEEAAKWVRLRQAMGR